MIILESDLFFIDSDTQTHDNEMSLEFTISCSKFTFIYMENRTANISADKSHK